MNNLNTNRFITEDEINKRREEFGVAKNTVSENYDPRPLWEKLQEKHEREQEEFAERMKPKPPRALDDEEFFFLQEQEEKRNNKKKELEKEDEASLSEFRKEQSFITLHPPDPVHIEVNKDIEKETIKSTSIVKERKTFTLKKKTIKPNSLPPVKIISKDNQSKNKQTEKQKTKEFIEDHKEKLHEIVHKTFDKKEHINNNNEHKGTHKIIEKGTKEQDEKSEKSSTQVLNPLGLLSNYSDD